MSTIWRPNLGRLRASVAEMEGSESEEEEKDATKKGVKRKRAPPTKGPCEHGVKPRSNASCAALVRTGSGASRCKECGGSQSASTAVGALCARSAAGLKSACTVVGATGARSAAGLKSASTAVGALSARSAAGLKSACTAVGALSARSAAGLKSACTAVGALGARSARNSPRWCSTLPLYYSSARDALGGGTRLTSVYFLLTSVTAAVSGVSLPLVASGLNSLCPLSYFIVASTHCKPTRAGPPVP